MNVGQALATARELGLDQLDATLLLAHHLQRRREWLLAHPEALLDAATLERFRADCQQRADDVPLAYLTGRREFRGLDLRVSPAVLVPRPETELLADWAIECLRAMPMGPPRQVIDLGTGSGALALAVAAACPEARVTGTDASAAALAVAQANSDRLGLAVHFALGHWWAAAGDTQFDLALANPPYIANDDPHLRSLRHEPQAALRADDNGMAALRQIIEQAPIYLARPGWLLLEHGWNQDLAVRQLLTDSGFREVQTRLDLQGHPRCSAGRLG